MKITVLDKSTLGADIDLSPIYALGEVLECERTAPDEIAERIKDTDVVIINKIKLNEKAIIVKNNVVILLILFIFPFFWFMLVIHK